MASQGFKDDDFFVGEVLDAETNFESLDFSRLAFRL